MTAVDDGGVYVINADGSGLRRLVDESGHNPVWSPDGRWIAYGSGAAIVDPRTGAQRFRNAPAGPANGFEQPAWSPDSTRIAFVGAPPTDYSNPQPIVRDIWVATVEGNSSAVRIATPEEEVGVSWLPDGRIAALSYEAIWTFKPDGSDRRRIYSGTIPYVVPAGQAAWGVLEASPDGRFLAAIPTDSPEDLIVDSDGNNPRIVVDGDSSMWGAAGISWSPSGDQFVYGSSTDGHPGASIAPSDMSASHLLDPWLGRPAWSPRSDLIAGLDNPAGGVYRQLVTMRPDGSARTTVLTVPDAFKLDQQINVSWSPDGRSITFSVGRSYYAPTPPGAIQH